MSSPRPPCAVGTARAEKAVPRRRSRQLSIGLVPSRSYSAARGAIVLARRARPTRSTTAPPAATGLASHRSSSCAADGLAVGRLAAAGVRLVQLDQVAVRVVHEDLLRAGGRPRPSCSSTSRPCGRARAWPPGCRARPGPRGASTGSCCRGPWRSLRRPVHAHEVDLRVVAAVHPVAVDRRDRRATRDRRRGRARRGRSRSDFFASRRARARRGCRDGGAPAP